MRWRRSPRDLDIPAVKPAQLRELISARMDSELFRLFL